MIFHDDGPECVGWGCNCPICQQTREDERYQEELAKITRIIKSLDGYPEKQADLIYEHGLNGHAIAFDTRSTALRDELNRRSYERWLATPRRIKYKKLKDIRIINRTKKGVLIQDNMKMRRAWFPVSQITTYSKKGIKRVKYPDWLDLAWEPMTHKEKRAYTESLLAEARLRASGKMSDVVEAVIINGVLIR